MEFEKEVLDAFNLQNAKVIDLNLKGTNKAFKIITKNKTFFLKQIFKFRNFDPEMLYEQVKIANHISKKGIKTFIPLKNKYGQQITVIKNEYFLLYDFFELDPESKYDENHFAIAAKELAKFHKALKNFKTKGKFLVKPLEKEIDSITNLTEVTFDFTSKGVLSLAKKSNKDFAKKVISDYNLISQAIIRTIHLTWNKMNCKQKTILHYDFGPHNIFFSKGEFIAISDFEFSHKGCIETDIVKAAKFWSEKEDHTLDITRFKRFIFMYNKKNKIKLDWKYFYGLTLFIILRRLIYAANYTLSKKDLSFLYDKDIKTIKFLMKNPIY